MPDHVIRLGSAWDAPARASGGAASGGSGRWRRRFGRPGGLAPGDRVVLVVEGCTVAAAVCFNGECVIGIEAGGGRWECDLTATLRDRNELVLDLAQSPALSDLLPGRAAADGDIRAGRAPLPSAAGAVRLEIFLGGPLRDTPGGGGVDGAPPAGG